MARTYGFGVIGLGMGLAHCRRMKDEKRARLVAVCDINEQRGQAAQKEFGVPWYTRATDLLRDPAVDVVIVATPTGLHAEYSIAAARAGKHVLCEKPIDVDVARARKIIAACKSAGVKLQVGFQNRCTADAMQTFQDVQAGRIGRLLFAQMQLHWWRGRPGYFTKSGWRGTWKYDGGGAFMNQGVHYVDLMTWFMGRPVAVVGRCQTTMFPIETEDVGMAIVKFAGGAQASLVATTTANPIEDDQTSILLQGSAGRIALAGSYQLKRTEVHLAKGPRGRTAKGTTLYADLVRAIETDSQPLSSGEQALQSLALIKAIYRSSKTGREVRLDS
jgi:UDP-N-acetyl-2-amino-2-deoxyglucuronate dehydrogenase